MKTLDQAVAGSWIVSAEPEKLTECLVFSSSAGGFVMLIENDPPLYI